MLVIFIQEQRRAYTVLKTSLLLQAPSPCLAGSLTLLLRPHSEAVWLHCSTPGSGVLLTGPCQGQEVPLKADASARGGGLHVWPILTGTLAATSWEFSHFRGAEATQTQAGVPTDLPLLPLFSEARDTATEYCWALLRHKHQTVSSLSLLK